MANTGDILAPKLLADGTFEETVLTPAAIGAAPIENPTFEGSATVTDGGDFLTLSAARIQSTYQDGLLDFEETRLAGPGGNVLNWEAPGQLSVENRTLKNLGAPAAANDAVRKTDIDSEAQTRANSDANLQTALAALESSLGTLSTQDSESVEITGGSAHFDTLSAGTDHAAVNGNLTIAANGDIIGTGANKLIGFTFIGTAGGATY